MISKLPLHLVIALLTGFALLACADAAAGTAPAYVDVTSFTSQQAGESLSATFHLAGLPASLPFNRAGTPDGGQEYSWIANVYSTSQSRLPDFQLVANALKTAGGAPLDSSIEYRVSTEVRKGDGNGGYARIGQATLTIEYATSRMTLAGSIPGLGTPAILCYTTYDRNPGGPEIRLSNCGGSAMVTTPDSFRFTPVADAQPGATVESNTVVVKGINSAARIEAAGAEISIDYGPYSPYPAGISNGQSVRVRATAPSTLGTRKDVSVNIGGVVSLFSITSKARYSDAERLLAWLQDKLPGFFYPPDTGTLKGSGYTYRYYSYTRSYLGVRDADGAVFATGGVFGNQLLSGGLLSDWLDTIARDGY